MNILSRTYIFYADIYFIQNFIIKVAVIYLSLYSNSFHFLISNMKGIGRIILAAGIGTLIEIAVLLLGNSYNLFLMLVHLLEIPFMIWFVVKKERQQMFRVILAGYFFLMIINAGLEILWNYFGEKGYYVFLLVTSCGMVYIGFRIFQNYNKIQKGIYPVEVLHGEVRMLIYALYDSGNHLIDPYTEKGVHIIAPSLIAKAEIDMSKDVYIPYQSLGNQKGIIKIYYIDKIIIQKAQKAIEYEMVPVGVAEETLFQNKRYQMILNEEVW